MKFIIEGRSTILDVIEADDMDQARRKFFAKYPAVCQIVDIREGTIPRKRRPNEHKTLPAS